MKWLKMRNKWAHGYEPWSYMPINEEVAKDPTFIEEEIISVEADRLSYSDKYRGIDWEIIPTKKVPNAKIEEALWHSKRNVDYHKSMIECEERKMKQIGELVGKGRKTDPDEIEKRKREKERQRRLAERY